MKELRAVYVEQLSKAMEQDSSILVLDADLAKAHATIGLRKTFPERCIEMGVAEQNMAGVAAGLASYGYQPYIHSFGTFASRRICDQIAISVCYAGSNVKIVGSDPGVGAELNGGTHMAMEDIGVLRSIPGLVIYEPADEIQLTKAMPQIIAHKGPVYIRLFRKAVEPVFDESYTFDLFRADVMKRGGDVTIFASGIMVQEAVKACVLMEAQGIHAELVNVHTIKPIDRETVLAGAKKTGRVVTCENHNVIGGLYSAVAETLCGQVDLKIAKIGFQDHFGEVGKMADLMAKFHMTAEDICDAAKGLL